MLGSDRAHLWAPISALGLPSRRARVKAEPTSCRRGGFGWACLRPALGKPQRGAGGAVVMESHREISYWSSVAKFFLVRAKILFGVDVQLLLFESFGGFWGFGKGVGEIL